MLQETMQTVENAEKKGAQIVEEAKEKAAQIVAEAKKEAAGMLNTAVETEKDYKKAAYELGKELEERFMSEMQKEAEEEVRALWKGAEKNEIQVIDRIIQELV